MLRKYRGAQRIVVVRQRFAELKAETLAMLARPKGPSSIEWMDLTSSVDALKLDAGEWKDFLAEVEEFRMATIMFTFIGRTRHRDRHKYRTELEILCR